MRIPCAGGLCSNLPNRSRSSRWSWMRVLGGLYDECRPPTVTSHSPTSFRHKIRETTPPISSRTVWRILTQPEIRSIFLMLVWRVFSCFQTSTESPSQNLKPPHPPQKAASWYGQEMQISNKWSILSKLHSTRRTTSFPKTKAKLVWSLFRASPGLSATGSRLPGS